MSLRFRATWLYWPQYLDAGGEGFGGFSERAEPIGSNGSTALVWSKWMMASNWSERLARK